MRFVVHGRVQGVGFRAATQRRALGLNLTGWVGNRADGRVEGVAAGSAEALARLRDWLARGPALAMVESVDWEVAFESPPTGFQVRHHLN